MADIYADRSLRSFLNQSHITQGLRYIMPRTTIQHPQALQQPETPSNSSPLLSSTQHTLQTPNNIPKYQHYTSKFHQNGQIFFKKSMKAHKKYVSDFFDGEVPIKCKSLFVNKKIIKDDYFKHLYSRSQLSQCWLRMFQSKYLFRYFTMDNSSSQIKKKCLSNIDELQRSFQWHLLQMENRE